MKIWQLCFILNGWRPLWSRTRLIQLYYICQKGLDPFIPCLSIYIEMVRTHKLDISFGWEPHEWGRQRANGRLVLIIMEVLFKVICWNCPATTKNTYVTNPCNCQKNETSCMQAYGKCRGHSCGNSMSENKIMKHESGGVILDDVNPLELQPAQF